MGSQLRKPLNPGSTCRALEKFIRESFVCSGRSGIVIPISGGLDSSVAATLCMRAIGSNRVTGLRLPERWGNPESEKYGKLIAQHLGIRTTRFYINGLLRGMGASSLLLALLGGRKAWQAIIEKRKQRRGASLQNEYLRMLRGDLMPEFTKYGAKINGRQRARMVCTYKYADEHNLMVVGAANKTERMVGLFAKFGIDDAADIMPLKNLYRSEILQLASHLEIPAEIRGRTPNPDMVPGVTDKYVSYLGMESTLIDAILRRLEGQWSVKRIAQEQDIDSAWVLRIKEIVKLTEFQRTQSLSPVMR